MLINQNELEKLCKYLYPKLFDYKDIVLNNLEIKIDNYIHIKANLNYYNIDTKLKAIARIRVENEIIIDIKGVIKYGIINLDLNKVLKETVKDIPYLVINDESIIIDNEYIKDIKLKDEYVSIELK
ncbi:hypothetical protein CWE04_13525 [Thomasclavelia cocleata]|uniref:Uncharacterized protein n=1 Tax=Thomasclavelia cocleata TaxID=69824 RepID=A0A1I0DRL0_9FIRM|nr:hypothetical protein [Thomasclavelia cocleata]MCR1960034.1 hypothetical protein [Thomasclavelia cocleata]NDO42986.1 hypothetical protein [Thomasclavelia cocleata]PJN79541.1 hypothetical protein CWE04_13525 [Thomasclavelia cocleata]SET35081.1 hypothetical protein SAMN04489758_10756 [Thomasclavelia cocleata]GFI40971.1 hypothetical protein IMSAGC017_01011 [Thomasclavelia cocleata]